MARFIVQFFSTCLYYFLKSAFLMVAWKWLLVYSFPSLPTLNGLQALFIVIFLDLARAPFPSLMQIDSGLKFDPPQDEKLRLEIVRLIVTPLVLLLTFIPILIAYFLL